MTQAESPRVRALVGWIYGLFFLSGALGLTYEVLWLRKLLLVFGSTVHATSTVLTAFFGGLALGSWVFGRLIDRRPADGLRWYARCELGIGLSALLTVPLFRLIEHVYIPLYRASGFSPGVLIGSAFLCSAAVLLIPTTLMGGTFPLLSRFLIRAIQERGVTIASLYALNTVGAMAGTIFVYYFSLQQLGWLITLQCAGLLNILIAVAARVVNRRLSEAGLAALPPSARSDRLSVPIPRKVRWVLAAFALSGFAAMVYEVAWTRSLSLVLGSSIYAFCLMLTTFLGGIALGSVLARRWLREHEADLWQFAAWEGILAGYGLLSIGLFGRLPDLFVALWPLFGGSFLGISLLQVGISLCVMALPTLVLGFLFPLVSDLLTGRFAQLGNRLGVVYAVNTAGGIVGSFLCGFWLIPTVGIAWTLVLAALVNLASALVIYVRFSSFSLARRLAFTGGSILLYLGLGQWLFVPSWRQQVMVAGAYLEPSSYRPGMITRPDEKLLFYRESFNATVSVHQAGDNIYLKVGGKTDASLGVDMGTQVLSGQIPLLLHPNPSRVLVIGMGSGITLGSAGRHPVRRLDCAEIDPAVVEGARFFGAHNYHVHDDPRTHIYVADGRNFLLATPTTYDVIISEPSNPWMAGVASLFTREFYELARRRLAGGGLMCQWLQLYRIFPSDVKLVLKTFHETFPYVSVWSTIPGDLILVGSLEPHQLHADRLAAAFNEPAIRDDLRRVGVTHPQVLAELFWFGAEEVERLTADQRWLHTDDLTSLEFDAPKALYQDRTLPINYQGLQQFKASSFVIAPGLADGRTEPAAQLALGRFYTFRKEPEKALAILEPAARRGSSHQADFYVEMAEAYAQKGEVTSAMEALRQARRADPRSFDAALRLARALMRDNRLDEALAVYDEAASLKPLEPDIAWEIGLASRKAGRWEEAIPYLEASIVAGPTHDQRSVALADTLYQLDRFEEAMRLLRPLADSKRSDVLLLLGKISAETGRPDEAARWYAQALRAAPSSAEASFGLAELAHARQDWRSARHDLLDGLRHDPYNVRALDRLRTVEAHLTRR